MKVYLVNSNVDLGYNVEAVFLSMEAAEVECKRLNDVHNEGAIRSLVRSGYPLEKATSYNKLCSDVYFIQQFEVQE